MQELPRVVHRRLHTGNDESKTMPQSVKPHSMINATIISVNN